jgi:DNA-nicking Smr family endonuclease
MSKKPQTGKPTSASPEDGESDAELFRREMSDTRVVDYETPVPQPRRVVPRARFRRQDEQDVLQESLAADIDETESHGGESLQFHRPHIGRRTLRRLARGSYSIQAECDLHGMTTSEAATVLREFIDDSRNRGLACVRVIHGKGLGSGAGGPILKGKVNAWLRRWDGVLAFVSARQVDGGTGAIHVLLKL